MNFEVITNYAEVKAAQAERDAEYYRDWRRKRDREEHFGKWVGQFLEQYLAEIVQVAHQRRVRKARLARGLRR